MPTISPGTPWWPHDRDGEVIYEAKGESLTPPSGTVTLEVLVGAQVERV